MKFKMLMKWICLSVLCVSSFPSLKSQDMVILKTGDEIEGKVLRVDKGKLVVETQVGGGKAASSYAIDSLEQVFFKEKFDRNAIPAEPNARFAALNPLWETHRQYLPIPESPAGEIGLVEAEVLIELKRFQEAFDIVAQISTNDWNAQRKLRTAPMKIKILAGLGRLSEALSEAKNLEAQANDSSTVAFMHLVMGEVEFTRTNYDVALDHFFFNRVFNPKQKEEAASGLWNAAKIYLLQTNLASAERTLNDIVMDYADCSLYNQAKAKLDEVKAMRKKQNIDEESEN